LAVLKISITTNGRPVYSIIGSKHSAGVDPGSCRARPRHCTRHVRSSECPVIRAARV